MTEGFLDEVVPLAPKELTEVGLLIVKWDERGVRQDRCGDRRTNIFDRDLAFF